MYIFIVLVCDAYIVQQPLITQIYMNGLFQTHNNIYSTQTGSISTSCFLIFNPINVQYVIYSVHTRNSQEDKYFNTDIYIHAIFVILILYIIIHHYVHVVELTVGIDCMGCRYRLCKECVQYDFFCSMK